MKKCVIVGSVKTDAFCEKEKSPRTLYIAADGGYIQMRKRGIIPDVLLGDFDSLYEAAPNGDINLSAESLNGTPVAFDGLHGVEIIKFPVEKDDTDTLIAVKEAIGRGCEEITLYGCLGGERFDHSIATLQTLTYAAERGIKITAVGDGSGNPFYVTALHSSEITFSAEHEGLFSVMCAGGECTGVTVENAKYCVENVTVSPAFPIGVSNAFIKGKNARVSVKSGTLWVFY